MDYCYRRSSVVCLCVSLLVMFVSRIKTAQPRGAFNTGAIGAVHRRPLFVKIANYDIYFRLCGRKITNRGPCENSCTDIYRTLKAPLAQPIEMIFGWVTLVGPRNHVLDWVEISHGRDNFGGLSGPLKNICKA